MSQKKVTINDVAQMAETSKTTVSFYLNGKYDKMSQTTKERIAAVIAETGFKPNMAARLLNAKKTQLIGVIIGDITNDFANKIVKGIDDVAKEHAYQLVIGNSAYDEKHELMYVERMLDMGVDGFIVQPTPNFENHLELIEKAGKSLVFIDSQTDEKNLPWVKTKHYEAVYTMTKSYAEKDYDHYLMIGADPSVLSARQERTQGFLHALKDQGKLGEFKIVAGDSDEDFFKEYFKEVLHPNERTLIFVANCWLLPRVYLGLEDYHHLLADELDLVGVDNDEWISFVTPRVKSLVQPAYEEGQAAARILIDQIEDKHIENWQQSLDYSFKK